jgi:hypothetical protein
MKPVEIYRSWLNEMRRQHYYQNNPGSLAELIKEMYRMENDIENRHEDFDRMVDNLVVDGIMVIKEGGKV